MRLGELIVKAQRRAFTGAWIETILSVGFLFSVIVAPSRARGLKPPFENISTTIPHVAPSRARGLKHPVRNRTTQWP